MRPWLRSVIVSDPPKQIALAAFRSQFVISLAGGFWCLSGALQGKADLLQVEAGADAMEIQAMAGALDQSGIDAWRSLERAGET